MCLYCMYLHVLHVYVAAGTRITAASPNDRLLRRHPAGLTQGIPGHGRKHFFPPSLYPRTTRFRAPPPLLPRRRSLNRPPRTADWSTRPDPSLSTRSQAPSQPIGEVSSLPETYSVCHSPPKTPPDRDWRMHVCACMCMYLHVLHVYVCICMYCLYVCVFDWRK